MESDPIDHDPIDHCFGCFGGDNNDELWGEAVNDAYWRMTA